MSENRLRMLDARGQSVWLDGITRGQLTDGLLLRLINEDGLTGVTTNPVTFEKAIVETTDYDQDILDAALQGIDAARIVDDLIVTDVQGIADDLRLVWDRTNGQAGYASIEVSPHLARDAKATVAEVHRLWNIVNRPNIMVKIPGTLEGLAAIRQCLADGVNINITLLFSVARYQEVVRAYFDAVETRIVRGEAVDALVSVASFFVSRIDPVVDGAIDEKLRVTQDPTIQSKLESLRGEVAIANAKLAYAHFAKMFNPSDDWWDKLAGAGARIQRPLWASTGMKQAGRPDVLYVEELVAPHTVVTMPLATLNAFRDHGIVRGHAATDNVDRARGTFQLLGEVGIDFDAIAARLEEDGIKQFTDAYDRLIAAVARKVAGYRSGRAA